MLRSSYVFCIYASRQRSLTKCLSLLIKFLMQRNSQTQRTVHNMLEKFIFGLSICLFILVCSVLLPCEVIYPVNGVENKKTTGETNSRYYVNLFCRKFIISYPSGQPVLRKAWGQNRS